jgi:hypothetical protein
MRTRSWILPVLALVVVAALMGCAKKEDTTASTTTTDSTAFATNPTEETPGTMTPQGDVPPPEATPPAPTETETPKATRAATSRTTAPRSTEPRTTAPSKPAEAPGIMVPSGTPVAITVNTKLSSETAQVGDVWTGVVKDNVNVGEKTVIPAGSVVNGTVTEVKTAAKGDRAELALAVSSITVEGRAVPVHASTEPIIAGSTRARNVGAVAGGAAAGALIGRAVGGSGKGALIGGLIGGAAAGGAVAKSKGYQVVLKEGTELTFSTSQAVSIRR